jgi:hypothetical protein
MNPFEDAYHRKCQELRQTEILNEELKATLDSERSARRACESRLTALETTLHVSRSNAFGDHCRPILTFVTTMRRGCEVCSVASQVDEMDLMASRDPHSKIRLELDQHVRKMSHEYLNRR